MKKICLVLSILFVATSSLAQTKISEPLSEPAWVQVPSGTEKALLTISAAGGSIVYAAGSTALLKSEDAGQTWRVLPPTSGIANLWFFDELHGVATPGPMLTDDGGMTWRPVENNGGEGGRAGAMFFPSRDTGFAVGQSTISRTTDGGHNWFVRQVGNSDLRGVHFLNNKLGYVVGISGAVFKTTDGGENWVRMTKPGSYTLNAVAALSNNIVCLGSVNGFVARSTDGGETWNDTLLTDPDWGFETMRFWNSKQGMEWS